MTAGVAVQTVLPDSKPGLPSFWPGLAQPPPTGLIGNWNEVEPVCAGFALSRADTVTLKVPAVVGVPEIRPEVALIDRPVGSPVADHVYGGVPPVAVICRLVAVPTV